MSDDDEIAKLLREVEAATGGGAKSAGSASPAAAGAPYLPATRAAGNEVAKAEGGSDTAKHLLVAGIAGAVVAFLVFGIVPFVGHFGVLSLAMAGFAGGAVGYGTTRFFLRDRD